MGADRQYRYNKIQKQEAQMSLQTQLIPMDIQVLESVLHNMDKQISKIQITLEFEDQKKQNKFANRINPIISEDEQIISSSDSDSDLDQLVDQGQNQENQQDGQVKGVNGVGDSGIGFRSRDVLDEEKLRLEMSIILKENYREQIQDIIKKTGVKILIVPEKLKYFGPSEEIIEQAKSEVFDIRDNLIISSIEKYGKQAYESSFLRNKLLKCGIKMGKVAEKYYYWYDSSICEQEQIKHVLSQIFIKNYHEFVPLLQQYEDLRVKFNQKYINAILQANASLYTKLLDSQINEQKNFRNAQLNLNKTEIIIHVPVRQQVQKIKIQIKKFYSEFIHFFIHFAKLPNQEIQNVREIQNLLTEKGIIWNRYEDLFVISFSNQDLEKHNQTILNVSHVPETKTKEFVENLRPVFELNANCDFEYLREGQQIDDEEYEEKKLPLHKRVTKVYKNLDGIFIISAKIQTPKTCIQIIEQMILKPKLLKDKSKKKSAEVSKPDQNNNNVSINQTSLLQDTTTLIQKTNLIQHANDVSVLGGNLGTVGDGSVLGELRDSGGLLGYGFYFGDVLGDNKYQEVDQITKKKPMRNSQPYEDQLQNMTKRKFKIYNVEIPQKMKYRFPNPNNRVTVFMKDSSKQNLKNSYIEVYLLENSKVFSNEGWLINVDKSDIRQNNYKYEIPTARMEIVNFIKMIQN